MLLSVFALLLQAFPAPVYCRQPILVPFGCNPSVTILGTPSASSGSGFWTGLEQVPPMQVAMPFYGVAGPASTPYGCSTLCLAQPFQRALPYIFTYGSGNCSGTARFDLNATGDPALAVPSVTVYCQWWFYDPLFAAPCDQRLSPAFSYTVGP
jgi:hypothetical protein